MYTAVCLSVCPSVCLLHSGIMSTPKIMRFSTSQKTLVLDVVNMLWKFKVRQFSESSGKGILLLQLSQIAAIY